MSFYRYYIQRVPLLFLSILILISLLFAVKIGHTTQQDTSKSSHPFPLYSSIVNNVSFWEKIYTTYSNDTIIVHDRDDLQKIYAIAVLPTPKNENDRQKNLHTEKKIKKKYTNILRTLRQHPPKNADEKRVAAFFTGPKRQQQLKKAPTQLRTQNGQQQRFRKSVLRSGAYLPLFKKIFKDYGLPQDLAYLPHVESSFYSGAYSKAGACGIWQFTKTTGRRYLIIDEAVDERLDPIAATHAAAKYFRSSYKHLKSWPLAIMSYNYGLPGTIRAQKSFGGYSKILKNHKTQSFGFASKNFYAEFLAARKAAKILEKKLPLQRPKKTCNMRLTGYLNLKDIISYFHVSKKQLRQLNPALRPSVFSYKKRISKNYTLHLPKTKAIQRKIVNFPKKLYYSRQKRHSRYYRVHRGETLSSIAAKFKVSVTRLQQLNHLKKRSIIRINQKLQIPVKREKHPRKRPLLLKKAKSKKYIR